MGEAKRRARFGDHSKIDTPLGRGLLFSTPFEQKGPSGFVVNSIPEEDFQSAILYWDKLICPTNNFVHVALPSEDLLIKENLLSRPSTRYSSMFSGDFVNINAQAQLDYFSVIEKEQPGYWCMTGLQPDKFNSSADFNIGRSALVSLTGALPLPLAKTPVENLLEFKLQRGAELKRLREALDATYLRIRENPDQEMAFQVAVRELDQSISDLRKSSREFWKNIKNTDIKTIMNFAGPAAVAGLAFSPAASAVFAVCGAIISVSNDIRTKRKQDRSSPYWYAVSVSKNLG
jgi:Family of unknown function (DUF6236)